MSKADPTWDEHRAYHEAAHAVACIIYGALANEVSILPDANMPGSGGHADMGMLYLLGSSREQYNTKLRILGINFAGRIGERFSPHSEKYKEINGAVQDIRDAARELIELFPDASEEEQMKIAKQALYHTAKLLARPANKEAIKQVAEALLKNGTLTHEQTVRIIKKARRQIRQQEGSAGNE